MSRLDGYMRLPRQTISFVCLMFLLGWLVTLVLLCQGSAYPQGAKAGSSAADVSQEVAAPQETTAADKQNPPPTQDNPNPAAADQFFRAHAPVSARAAVSPQGMRRESSRWPRSSRNAIANIVGFRG